MIFSDIFALFLAQNFKTKVLTAQKNLLLECLVPDSRSETVGSRISEISIVFHKQNKKHISSFQSNIKGTVLNDAPKPDLLNVSNITKP